MTDKFPAWMNETQCQRCPEYGYCDDCAQACFRRWKKCDDEIQRLSGKTGFCLQCETYARKIERYEKALKEIRDNGYYAENSRIAKEALTK